MLLPSIACTAHKSKYTIETFQLMNTEWEQQLYDDMRREAFFHDDFKFIFNIAGDAAEEARQIEKAVGNKADAIVVNPYDTKNILPVIESAYEAGINVILVGQKLPTYKYHAYVGPDSRILGAKSAEFICKLLPDGGNIVVIEAYTDAPYYQERQEGFSDIIKKHENISIVGCIDAQWDKDLAHHKMDSLKAMLSEVAVDVVYAYGDDMINGAIESETYPDAMFVGGDGISRDGLKYMETEQLMASFINSTGGSMAIKTAVDIVMANKYKKDNYLESFFIEANQYKEFSIASAGLQNYKQKIDALNRTKERHICNMKIMYGVLAILITAFIIMLVALLLSARFAATKIKENEENTGKLAELQERYKELHLQNEINEQILVQLQSERESLIDAVMNGRTDMPPKDPIKEAVLIKRFREYVSGNLYDSGMSIESISLELGMSRAQLFRKIKEETGSTPNELIQTMRLEKANEILRSSDKTVSEVAYEVGFTSPSYFSKCYKDRFGLTPNALRGGTNPLKK